MAELGELTGNAITWNLHIPRKMNVAARNELNLLLADFPSFNFNQGHADEIFWPYTPKKVFSVKSMYDKLSVEEVQHNPAFYYIWSLRCPPKVFLWLIAHGRLATTDMLIRRRINVPENCLFYAAAETISRLLLHCDFSRSVWDFLTVK